MTRHSTRPAPGPSGPLNLSAPLNIERFRAALSRGNFNETAIAELMGPRRPGEPTDWPVLNRRIAEPTPLHLLFSLFVLGRSLNREQARRLFDDALVGEMLEAGIARAETDSMFASVKLVPFKGVLCLSDFLPEDPSRGMPEDFVPTPALATASLVDLTVRRRVGSAVDIGTGSGAQAFLLAANAARVVGTDTNRRALNLAAMGAGLNGIEHAEWRAGSFFEPVAGERFGLVVANPPFVISPESRFSFRDGGLGKDAVSEHVVHNAGQHLEEGGYACILINWYHQNDDDWAARPSAWVKDTGCDAWILRFQSADPLSYAANWLRQTEDQNRPQYEQRLEEWLQYYQREGIAAISAGAVILRRASNRPNWVRTDWVSVSRQVGTCGDQIERIFANEDLVRRIKSDDEWLALRFRLHAEHVMEQRFKAKSGGWAVISSLVRSTQGVSFSGNLDSGAARLLAGCDGSRTLREIVATLAGGGEEETRSLAPSVIAGVKAMLYSGLLEAAHEGGASRQGAL